MARNAKRTGSVLRVPATATTTSKNVKPARSLRIGQDGIRTGRDFAGFMSALMTDVVDGRVTPQVANAACNAGGKLLKVVEMEFKYSASKRAPARRQMGDVPQLQLASGV